MIVRLEKCPSCGEGVTVVMPDLFPNLDAKKLEKFKVLSTTPVEKYCKNCRQKKGAK